MKITPVSYEFVKENVYEPNIYRISICDDGKDGKAHRSVRVKPLKNMTIEELEQSRDNNDYAFVVIE